MEIVPGLRAIRLLGSKAYLLTDGDMTLVDAGLRGSGRLLERYLAGMGCSARGIARILCTHGHPDHIGGVREIAAMTGARIFMHEAEVEHLRTDLRLALRRLRPSAFVAAFTTGPEDAEPLHDAMLLPIMGGVRVVHTPGHTPGSVCFYVERHRLLIAGDVLQVQAGRLTLPSYVFTEDMDAARRSIRRLAALDVETICFAHFATWRSRGGEALRDLVAREGGAA